jgi:glycosyltransferase involved in cell wall biosynthesis
VTITKNEERNIAACLESVCWADERIVVDASSTDRTTEVARRYTDHVFIRGWPGYGPQKNFAIDHCTADWILVLDADERVTESLGQEIRRMLSGNADAGRPVAFEIPRRNFFYGKWIRGGGLFPDYQIRLFRRGAARYDETLLHERLQITGPIGRLTSCLDHHSMPTVAEHVRKMIRYTTLGAQEKLKDRACVSFLDLGANHLVTIIKTYLLRRGYRDGVHGLVVALFAGMHVFVKYAKAWETRNVRREA